MSLLSVSAAFAQIVNTQPLLQPPEDGMHVEATSGGSWLTGNVPLLTARAGLLLRYRRERHTVISSSRVEFGRGGGDPFLNRQTSHLRYQLRLTDVASAEAFVQGTHDEVWRLKLRVLGGGGIRVTAVDEDAFRLTFGLGAFWEHERLNDRPDVGDANLRRSHPRLNSYATGAWRLDEQLSLLQTIYFQPRADDLPDVRLLSHTALAVKVRDRLAFSTSLQIAYSSWTPETILPLDTTTLWDFTWSF